MNGNRLLSGYRVRPGALVQCELKAAFIQDLQSRILYLIGIVSATMPITMPAAILSAVEKCSELYYPFSPRLTGLFL